MKSNNYLIISALLFAVIGCTINKSNAYSKDFTMDEKEITKISKNEAITRAKDYVIQQGWDDEYKVSKPIKVDLDTLYKYSDGTLSWTKLDTKMTYEELRKRWVITFAPKKTMFKGGFQFFVIVNADTGEIETEGNFKR